MNITTLLLHIANFIKNRSTMCDLMNDITQLEGFSQATWEFISSIYEAKWDILVTNSSL